MKSLNILIPYDQILHIELVTPSVLSLRVKVNRYFGSVINENGSIASPATFREADVELFTMHCPGTKLYQLLLERKSLAKTRESIKLLISEGLMDPSSSTAPNTTAAGEGLRQIDTVDLSLGSETIKTLDSRALALEGAFNRTVAKWNFSESEESDKAARFALIAPRTEVEEWSTTYDFRTLVVTPSQSFCTKSDLQLQFFSMARKAARLRIYIGTLLGYGLEGTHNYDPDEVDQLIQRDFAIAQSIGVDDPGYHKDLRLLSPLIVLLPLNIFSN